MARQVRITDKFLKENLGSAIQEMGSDTLNVDENWNSAVTEFGFYQRFEASVINQTQDMIKAYYIDGKQYAAGGHRVTLKKGKCSDCGKKPLEGYRTPSSKYIKSTEAEQAWAAGFVSNSSKPPINPIRSTLIDTVDALKTNEVFHRPAVAGGHMKYQKDKEPKAFSVMVAARVFMREFNKNLRKNNPRVTCFTYGDITTLKSLEKVQQAKKNLEEAREVQKLGDTPQQKEYSRILGLTEANLVAVEGKIKKNLESQRLDTRRKNKMLTKEDKQKMKAVGGQKSVVGTSTKPRPKPRKQQDLMF